MDDTTFRTGRLLWPAHGKIRHGKYASSIRQLRFGFDPAWPDFRRYERERTAEGRFVFWRFPDNARLR
jgi:hypothetical protein